MAVAGTHFTKQPISRFVIEMREWHAARSGQHRSLNNAIVDQRVVDNDVIAPEKMADDRDIGRMTADEDQTVLGAVNGSECLFELAVDRPLARDRTARRHRRAVAVDGFLRDL